MTFEQPNNDFKLPNPPEEINIPVPELKTNSEGKQYEYQKDDVYYGGDYLAEPPQEITLGTDLPPAPPHEPPMAY